MLAVGKNKEKKKMEIPKLLVLMQTQKESQLQSVLRHANAKKKNGNTKLSALHANAITLIAVKLIAFDHSFTFASRNFTFSMFLFGTILLRNMKINSFSSVA